MKEQLDTLKQLVYILTGTTVEKGEDQYKDTENRPKSLESHFRSVAVIRMIRSTGF